MDISILISVLSLLVAALAEARSLEKDREIKRIRPVGIALLQLLLVIDDIIVVGNELIEILAKTPMSEDIARIALLGKKWKILKLIQLQQQNLQNFVSISSIPLTNIESNVQVKLSDVISLNIPDEVEKLPGDKGGFLRILTWKLLEGEVPLSRFSVAACLALRNMSDSMEIDQNINYFSLKFPTKIVAKEITPSDGRRIRTVITDEQFATYDLTKAVDLRRLLEVSKMQLDNLGHLREQLAQLINESFPIGELTGKG